MNQNDLAQAAVAIPHRINDRARPTFLSREVAAIRHVRDRRNLHRFPRKRAPDERHHAGRHELRVFEQIVIGDLFQRNAPEFFPRAIHPQRPPGRVENLHAERHLLHEELKPRIAAVRERIRHVVAALLRRQRCCFIPQFVLLHR